MVEFNYPRTQWIDRIKSNPAHKDLAIADFGFAVGEMSGITINREQRLITGTLSTPTIDEEDEVLVAVNFDRSYFPNRVKTLYIDHDYAGYPLGVGHCRKLYEQGGNLVAQSYITKLPIGDDLITVIEEGTLRHYTIGANKTNRRHPTLDEVNIYGPCNTIVTEGQLLEYSFTTMPCNADAALDEMVSKSRIRRDSAVAFGLKDTPVRKFYPTHGAAQVDRPVYFDYRTGFAAVM